MRSSKLFLTLLTAIVLIHAAAATASGIDMDDPRRALGRENDVRVDAQLARETVSPGSPIGVTFQVQNFTDRRVAVAPKVVDASYDHDSGTITVAIGSEVPQDGNMPLMVLIEPGEKKVFRTAATPVFSAAVLRASYAASPRLVQVKVAILRDVEPFVTLIEAKSTQRLSDALFDRWFESNDTIFLNTLPVQFTPNVSASAGSAERRGGRGGF